MYYAVVYMHTNRYNGKSYIGFGLGINGDERRWKDHVKKARAGSIWIFHKAIMKYGDDAWDHKRLEVVEHHNKCECIKEAKRLEVEWILREKTFFVEYPDRGYNMTRGGDGGFNLGRVPWNKGKTGIYSKEHIEFLRKNVNSKLTFLGKRHTIETIEKIRMSHMNKVHNVTEAMIESCQRRWQDPEERKKMSEKLKCYYENPEARKKASERAKKRRGEKRKCKTCGGFGHFSKTCKKDV